MRNVLNRGTARIRYERCASHRVPDVTPRSRTENLVPIQHLIWLTPDQEPTLATRAIEGLPMDMIQRLFLVTAAVGFVGFVVTLLTYLELMPV